jgi:hypothetical protein
VNRQLALNEGINITKLVLSKVVLSILYLILVFFKMATMVIAV